MNENNTNNLDEHNRREIARIQEADAQRAAVDREEHPEHPASSADSAPPRRMPNGGLVTMSEALASLRRGSGTRVLRPVRKHDASTRNRSQ